MIGSGRREAFLVELAMCEIKRQRLLKAFSSPEPIWKDEDHPEIEDSANWVRRMRAESEARFERIYPDGGE